MKDAGLLLVSLSLYRSLTLSFVCLMASLRRFGSCSSCKLRNAHKNRNERRRKCRSAVPEWLLGSRIKAQGEGDEDGCRGRVGTPKTKDTPQAGGVCSLCFQNIFSLQLNCQFQSHFLFS
ncbi:hypothetical protein ILYODFUR_024289 [Ilyodon furcidens]|uniref:Secreted protein n=1 Tax=Ilyodon furcidens TaxID=33524 RepID=A0ABV0TXB5_9TELE